MGELDSGTIERLEKQGKLLLRIYQAELAKDPSSQGTESSRSNVIALRHTVQQIYGMPLSPGSHNTYFPFRRLEIKNAGGQHR